MNLITRSLRRGAYLLATLSLSSPAFAAQPPEYEASPLEPVIAQIESQYGPFIGVTDIDNNGRVFMGSTLQIDETNARRSHIWDSVNGIFIANNLPGLILEVRGNYYSYATNMSPAGIDNNKLFVCQVSQITVDANTGDSLHGDCETRVDNSLFGPVFKDIFQILSSDLSMINSDGWAYELTDVEVPGSGNDPGNVSILNAVVTVTSPSGEVFVVPNQTQLTGEIGNCQINFLLPEGNPPTLHQQQCLYGENTSQFELLTNVKSFTPDINNPGEWIEENYSIPEGEILSWVRSDKYAYLGLDLFNSNLGSIDPSNPPEFKYCNLANCENTISTIEIQTDGFSPLLRFNEGPLVTGTEGQAFTDPNTGETQGLPYVGNIFVANATSPNYRRYLNEKIVLNDGSTAASSIWMDLSLSGEYGVLASGSPEKLGNLFGALDGSSRPELFLIKQSNSCAPLTMTAATVSTTQSAAGQTEPLAPCDNLIVNGSFENHGGLNRGNWGLFRNIEGWKSHKNRKPFEIQTNGVGGVTAYDGNAVLELDGNKNAQAIQKINTTAGQQYTLSLAYSPRVESGKYKQHTNRVDVFWNGKRIAKLNGDSRGWQQHSFTVTAASNKSRLVLKAKGRSDSYGGLIDDIRLVADLGAAQFTSSAPTSQQAGTPYQYSTALEGIGEAPHYFLDAAPEGMQISTDGTISWDNPTQGSYPINIRAIDSCGREAVQTFILEVFLPSECL